MLVLVLSCALTVSAQPGDNARHDRADRESQVNQLVPGKSAGISKSQAAARVKQRYRSSRIMGIAQMDGATPLYRVRLLSEEGVVSSVFVDGRTGEVFE